MSFLRPELAARLRRWREPLVWGALLAFGVWLAWRGYGALAPLPFLRRAARSPPPASGCCRWPSAGCGSAPRRWTRGWC